MTSKIDVSVILAEHFATFRDEATNRYSVLDFVVMLALPGAVAILASIIGFHIKDDYVGTLISAFAIFSGLLFNVLVLIYSITDTGPEKDEVRERLISQTFANISFSVMSCLVAVMLLSILLFVQGLAQAIVESLVYFIGLNFMLTMLMVLKRMHILMRGGA